tara:strand:- start:1368 stop:2042 length:675 start_codon:yes stop_codon:yes gene_type:complete
MHQKRSKKILLFFFLFLLIGTYNNKNFTFNSFGTIDEIIISGLEDNDNIKLKTELSFLRLENLFFLNKEKIEEILKNNNLVEKYSVSKKYPSTVNIKIEKTTFLALIKKENINYLLGSNGKLVKSKDKKDKIPMIFGEFNNKYFFDLKSIVDESNFDYAEIKNLFFFKSGRWDIETNSGILIKLPKKDLKKSLNFALEIMNKNQFEKITKIDLRQKNQVVIDEK